MTFKKIAGKVHLWLGIPTGLVVFIVAITGCLYCFQEEIGWLYDDYKTVEAQDQAFISPSEVHKIGEEAIPGKHIHSVIYGDKTDALEVVYYEAEPEFYHMVYLNPYNGDVIKVVNMEAGFFHFVLEGHIYLWMGEFGKTIVSYSTLIFLVILISGLILWWPRNRKAAKKRLKLSWTDRTKWKRRNYDLHNVLGFYASTIALLIAITGLVYAFSWFSEGLYGITGGESSPTFVWPQNVSATADKAELDAPAIDLIWQQMVKEYPDVSTIEMHYPVGEGYTVYAYMRYSEGTYWDTDSRYFDSRTLEEIVPGHIWGKLETASTADMIRRMNYDIHVGAIGGIAGKIIVFLSSLIVGSLPVTGITIWWGRRKKKTKKNTPSKSSSNSRKKAVSRTREKKPELV
ncbi:MAG: PepSY domain-containing protein [Balneolaceae bacterium]|nr:PepSY domain-containing protein [Balneolaceae bacterium]